MENKQTAVEWLIQRIYMSDFEIYNFMKENADFEQAKEMEKEQIENAYQAGQDNVDYTASFVDENGLENYYNETYGGNI
jgi:hypothetical protein